MGFGVIPRKKRKNSTDSNKAPSITSMSPSSIMMNSRSFKELYLSPDAETRSLKHIRLKNYQAPYLKLNSRIDFLKGKIKGTIAACLLSPSNKSKKSSGVINKVP
jgi:hypothetical protein